MPYEVKAMPDVPCLYARYYEMVTADDLTNAATKILDIRKNQFPDAKQIYLLADFNDSDSNFGQMLKNINVMPKLIRTLEKDNIKSLVIVEVNNPWLRLSRDFLKRVGIGVVVFETIDAGIEYIHLQVSKIESKRPHE